MLNLIRPYLVSLTSISERYFIEKIKKETIYAKEYLKLQILHIVYNYRKELSSFIDSNLGENISLRINVQY